MKKNSLFDDISETVSMLNAYGTNRPDIGIILGTGLGNLTKHIDIQNSIDYEDIPHFKPSTAESHSGNLIFGNIHGKNIVAMQGRLHCYEGYSMQEITYPVRVMKELGVKILFISNASGSVNPLFEKGELMILDDFINLLGNNPLTGKHDPRMGPSIPDMSEPYSQRLIALAEDRARELKIPIYKGVYAAMMGPSLETRAEYRFLRTIGADAVGMSTVPETIVAKQIGLETFGISILTNHACPNCLGQVSLQEIIAAAEAAEHKLTQLILELIRIA